MDKVILNGKEYELPKKTLRVERMIDEVYKADAGTREQSVKQMYKFVQDVLGKENADEVLDCERIDDVDTQDLIITFKKIEDAYLERVAEFNRQQQYDKLNQPAFDMINKVGNSVANFAPLMSK